MSNCKNRKINEWSNIFSELYSKADSKRSPEQLWIATTAHCSTIGELIRRMEFPELLKPASHAFCWLCSFINKCNQINDDVFSLNEQLCELVSLKYPGECGHCEKDPCQCNPIEMDAIQNKSARYERLLEERNKNIIAYREYTINDWKSTFQKIYGKRVYILTIEIIGFHFLEEVGEVSRAIRFLGQLRNITNKNYLGIDKSFINELTKVDSIVEKYKEYEEYKQKTIKEIYTSEDPEILKWRIISAKMDLIIEIADTFSWFCSILNKLEFFSSKNNFHLQPLQEKLEEEYIDNNNPICPTCRTNPCSCLFFP